MPGKTKPGDLSQQQVDKVTKSASLPSIFSLPHESLEHLKELERQLQIVLNGSQIGIWEWDIASNLIHWAGSIFDLSGEKPSRVPTPLETYLESVHPEDREKVREAISYSLQTDNPFQVEHRLLSEHRPMRWLESIGNVVRDGSGNAIKMTGTVQDITGKKKIENEKDDWKIRHEMISTSAGIVIYDYNVANAKILWSGNSREVLGYAPDELGDLQRWSDLVHPNDRDAAFMLLEDAQKKIKPYDVYYRFLRKDGQYIHMHDRGFFLAAGGIATRMLGMMTDVTERIKAEDSLRESELRFRTLQEASFGGIGLHDKGVILDCNQGLCDITGYSYAELIGSNGLDLIAPEWKDVVLEKIVSGFDRTYDVEGIRKDGSRYFLEIRGKNMPYDGRTIRVTEFRDVTDRKETEYKIKEQNARLLALTEDLRRKNSQLEEFTQIVSHNLRAPVGNILTLLTFYKGSESAAEKEEYIELLQQSGQTILSMLNELNDILKIRQSKHIEKQLLKFDAILQRVVMLLHAKITGVSATITSDFAEAPEVEYPSLYLESIMLNLIDNALKYHHPDRAPIIHLKSYMTEEGHVILEVTDNGLGINLERYGHQVFRLRKTFHYHPESRGIGLFIVKNQIDAMGGDITVTSEENKGTTFQINFNKYQTDDE